MRFTAIDFETANSERSSACAVGLVIVDGGQIVDQVYQLIRPHPPFFDPFNVSIHGITPRDVAQAPSFAEYWPSLMANVSGPLVAHNASFDMSVIRHALKAAGMPHPEVDYFCTCVIAKLTWPGQPNFKLNHIARCLGIRFQHHNAVEDARACALIALEACSAHGVASLHDLRACGLRIGSLSRTGYKPCGGPRGRRSR